VAGEDYERGLELARRGKFFEAHEAFEAVWRRAGAGERDFYQGLVHTVVAWFQAERQNDVGSRSQLQKARRRLAPYAPSHEGLDVSGLLHTLDLALASFPSLPELRLAPALAGGEELGRALAFIRGIQDRTATESETFPLGRAFRRPDLPLIWDLNFVRVEELPPETSAAELAADADRLHANGVAHRKIVVHGERTAARLAPGFRELGWRVDRNLVMALRELRPPGRAHDVLEVERASVKVSELEFVLGEDPTMSDDAVKQVLAISALTEQAVSVRTFATLDEGSATSWCELYSDGHTADVESVSTLRARRGRGLASAVVTTAARAALDAGHDFVFLVVEEDEGPVEVYRRLGFEGIGREIIFFRPPPSS
jgi:predicted metal-dependent hydrolase/ribosomal protein S18 acetylase RimI-like enzyme